MENLTKKQKGILFGLACAALLLIGYYIMQKTKTYDSIGLEELVKTDVQGSSKTNGENSNIVVHITGSVRNEGVISIEENARIIDVIEKAGGLIEEADISNVNLAYMVKDGQKIYIPSIYDEEIQEQITSKSGDNIIIDTYDEKTNVVNINKATQTELETLNGIGPSTALKIIEYREKNGKFKKAEDLMEIPGIGESKFNMIKDDICV